MLPSSSRDPKTLTNYLQTSSRVKNIPQVPFRNRGKEHSVSGSSWSFDRSDSISRQAGSRGWVLVSIIEEVTLMTDYS